MSQKVLKAAGSLTRIIRWRTLISIMSPYLHTCGEALTTQAVGLEITYDYLC